MFDENLKNDFATPHLYNSAKQKIEERRLAQNSKNSQGLQFRSGAATTRIGAAHKRSFRYQLRAKLLGNHGKGDLRLFAEPFSVNINNEELTLHVFRSVAPH